MKTLLKSSAVVLVLLSSVCFAQQQLRLITVSGTADVNVEPDKVEITIGIVNRAPNAKAAMGKNEEIAQKLIKTARAFNLGKDDVDAGYTSLTYRDKTDKRPQAYFEADQRVSFTLHDLQKYGAFLSAVIEAGANRIDGVDFQASNLPELRKKARAMAVRAAREKAEQLAQESGVRISRLHSLDESSAGERGYAINLVTRSGTEESEASIIRGKINVTVVVGASYEIE